MPSHSESKGGGRGRNGSKKISGVEFSWDPELDIDKPAPSPQFPEYHPQPPKPLTKDEETQVSRFLSFRSSVHEGPIFTVLGDNVRVGKATTSSAAAFDPFEGMPTYSQKYTKRRRRLPKLDTRPYVLKFFPKELWSTLDPTSTVRTDEGTQVPRKNVKLSNFPKMETLDKENMSGDEEEGGEKQQNDDEDAEQDDADEDNEYEEDDDEGGDYNAEQYFDDGGDDAGNDYEGGEGDGGDFY